MNFRFNPEKFAELSVEYAPEKQVCKTKKATSEGKNKRFGAQERT